MDGGLDVGLEVRLEAGKKVSKHLCVWDSLDSLGDGSTNERTTSPWMKVITFNSEAYAKVRMAHMSSSAQRFFSPGTGRIRSASQRTPQPGCN